MPVMLGEKQSTKVGTRRTLDEMAGCVMSPLSDSSTRKRIGILRIEVTVGLCYADGCMDCIPGKHLHLD